MTAARVEGFRAGGLAVTLKHFAGYGAAEGGRDYNSSVISPSLMRNVYLPPFQAAVRAGGGRIRLPCPSGTPIRY